MTRNNLEKSTRRDGAITVLAIVGLGMWVAIGSSIALRAVPTQAQSISEHRNEKAEWQSRFRGLRLQEARLKKTIELATKEYADANRRSYRRSGVRHFHRANAQLAKDELAKVRAELVKIYDDARVSEVPLIWLYEVEDEEIDPSQVTGLGDYANERGYLGASAKDASGEESERDTSDDAGRNPIHLRDKAPPASREQRDAVGFDYEAWRQDREKYEGRVRSE